MKLIDKDVVVAKIEKWRDGIKKGIFSIPLTGSDRAYATFEYEMLGKVKDFLDTFEVKEWTLVRKTDGRILEVLVVRGTLIVLIIVQIKAQKGEEV